VYASKISYKLLVPVTRHKSLESLENLMPFCALSVEIFSHYNNIQCPSKLVVVLISIASRKKLRQNEDLVICANGLNGPLAFDDDFLFCRK
jgi:hypothetical protein